MKESVFIDSDILFRNFAISRDKLALFNESGSTGIKSLDDTLILIKRIEDERQNLCISEFSLLELICILNRLHSAPKIPRVLERLRLTSEILPLEDITLSLAQFLGANFELHSGDAIHASFCILNDINLVFLSDASFCETLGSIQEDFSQNGTGTIERYYATHNPTQFAPSILLKKYENLGHIEISQV